MANDKIVCHGIFYLAKIKTNNLHCFLFLHTADDFIFWNAEHPLKKEDFKGKSSAQGHSYGSTYSAILLHTKEENEKIDFVIEAVFIPSRSWLKTDSEYGLKHEQGHFDITEIYARK